MKSNVLIILMLLGALIGMASATTTENDATVSVTISSETFVNIDPDAFTWTGVNPGTQVGVDTNGYHAILIENVGSQNITKIWANATYDTARPWGTGDPAAYNAGNFLMLTANDTDSHLYFVNRVEYNESGVLTYLKDPNGIMPPVGFSYGRFRNASNEYFWMIEAGADNKCNTTGDIFRVGTVPHTRTQSGTTDFSGVADTELSLTTDATNNGWAYVAGSGATAGYCIAVKYNCGEVWFYHWNMDAPGAGACANAKYLKSATGLGDGSLAPGAYIGANITLAVPYGVAKGQITGVLTILASDA